MLQLRIVLITMVLMSVSLSNYPAKQLSNESLNKVDHLVYATPDLNRGIAEIEKLTGVHATAGGQHPGRGTRNAIVALGPSTYLEIIAPDPDQPAPAFPRSFGLDNLTESRLVTWAVKDNDLDHLRESAAQKGLELGQVISGRRKRPDGVLLSWRFTNPGAELADGIVPFFIDWGKSSHPAQTAARGLTLVDLRAEHPDAAHVAQMLRQLGLSLTVTQGPKPALIAVINGPRGRIELR